MRFVWCLLCSEQYFVRSFDVKSDEENACYCGDVHILEIERNPMHLRHLAWYVCSRHSKQFVQKRKQKQFSLRSSTEITLNYFNGFCSGQSKRKNKIDRYLHSRCSMEFIARQNRFENYTENFKRLINCMPS